MTVMFPSQAFVGIPDEFRLLSIQTDPTCLPVTVLCSACVIPCGATFFARQGREQSIIVMDTYLPANDWRRRIGGEERVLQHLVPSMMPFYPPYTYPVTVRYCNWVRFLSRTDDKKAANLILLRQNPPTFQTTQQINAGDTIRLQFGSDFNSEAVYDACAKVSLPATQDLATAAKTCSVSYKSPANFDSFLHSTLKKLITVEQPSKCTSIPEASSESTVCPSKERKNLQCSYCPSRFDRPSLLQRHERIHTGEKPFHCSFSDCGKSFSTSSSLNTHRRTHTGDRPHFCPECPKRFTASSNLYYHRFVHKDPKDRPHKCHLCDKGFTTPGDLANHVHTHNNSWPLKCDYCSKGFCKANQLKTHLKTHKRTSP